MKIEAGGLLIACKDIYDEPATVNGVSVRQLRLELDAPLSQEELSALAGNHWTLYEEDGTVAGVKSGFNQFQGYSASFARVQDSENLQIQIEAMARELAAKKVEATSAWGMFDSIRVLMDAAGVTMEALQETAARKIEKASLSETEPENASMGTPVK